MNKKLIKYCNVIIEFGLPILAFLIALSFYLKTYDSCQIKITLLHIGATIIVAAWIIKVIERGRLLENKEQRLYAIPALFFLLSGIVSFAISPFRFTSFEELTRRVLYIGTFLIALVEFNSQEKVNRMFRWILAATFIAVFYGLIQFMELDPFIWKAAFGDRIFSTFGNPNFFAAFLVLVTPLLLTFFDFSELEKASRTVVSLVLVATIGIIFCFMQFLGKVGLMRLGSLGTQAYVFFVENKTYAFFFLLLFSLFLMVLMKMKTKKLLVLFLFIVLINLITTRTKASYIGFVAGVSFFTLVTTLFIVPATKKQKKTFLAVFLSVLILGTGGAVTFLVRQRIDSVRFRVFTWLSTLEMIKDYPEEGTAIKSTPGKELMHAFLGTGIGTFKIVYPAFRRPEIFHIEGKHNTETDHPENEFIEIWYDEGIVGFGIFLWFLLVIFFTGIKRLIQVTGYSAQPPPSSRSSRLNPHSRKGGGLKIGARLEKLTRRRYLLIGLLSGLFGLMVHNLMCVNMRFVSSGFVFWLFLGLLGGQIVGHKEKTNPVLENERNRKFLRNKSSRKVIQAIIIILTLFLVFFFRRFFIADIHHNVAIAYSKAGSWESALKQYQTVLRNNPYYAMTHYFMGNVYNDRWNMKEVYDPRWDSVKLEQKYFFPRIHKLLYGTEEDPKNPRTDADRAVAKYADLKRLAPNYVQVHFQEGSLYTKLKDWDKAIESFEKYLDLDPVFASTYFKMGWCYVQKKDWVKAEEVYLKAVEWNPNLNQAYINLGNVYFMQKKFKEAEESFKKTVELNNSDIGAHRSLATFYWNTNRRGLALKEWKRILELNPDDKQAKSIIEQMTGLKQKVKD
ncbi:tetratricopeptide repeat protein [bacterium]|nr:tetratricopeptide repeat protein [bacterium]NIO73938.1 tetratricopeptide repeat protein [bacterium]